MTLRSPAFRGGYLSIAFGGQPPAVVLPPTTPGLARTTWLRDSDTNDLWSLTEIAPAVFDWSPVGNRAGPGVGRWPKYVVSEQPTPLANFSTLEAGVAAAAADLHGPGAPTVVGVFPGAYAPVGGSVTLPPGIVLQRIQPGGDGGQFAFTPCDVQVTGGLVVLGGGPAALVDGFVFATTDGTPALRCDDAAPVFLSAQSCRFESTQGPAVSLKNTGLGSTAALTQCTIYQTDPAPGVEALTVGMNVTFARGILQRDPAARGVALTPGASLALLESTSFGQFFVDDGAFLDLVRSSAGVVGQDLFVTATPSSFVRVDPASNLRGRDPLISGPGSYVSATFEVQDPEFTGVTGAAKAAAVVSYSIPQVKQDYVDFLSGAGPHEYPLSADVLQLDTGGANVVCLIPPLDICFNGRRICVKVINPLGDISIKPDAADQIDNLPAGIAWVIPGGTTPATGWVVLEAVNIPFRAKRWNVLGSYPETRVWIVQNATGVLPTTAREVFSSGVSNPSVLELPSTLLFPNGDYLEIKRTNKSVDHIVRAAAAAGDNVDGAASVTMTDAVLYGCVTVRCDRANRSWVLISALGAVTLP